MIELAIYGNAIGGDAAEMTVNVDVTRFLGLDVAVDYYLGRLTAAMIAPFQTIDTITLSNHETGHLQSWVVTEENVNAPVAVKYATYIIEDIMGFVDDSRDKSTVDMVTAMRATGKTPDDIVLAVIELGYAPFFATMWVSALMSLPQ